MSGTRAEDTPRSGFDHIGRSIPRKEDARLLRGRGRFLDDVEVPGALHACFVRSPHGHARILSIDITEAASVPGV